MSSKVKKILIGVGVVILILVVCRACGGSEPEQTTDTSTLSEDVAVQEELTPEQEKAQDDLAEQERLSVRYGKSPEGFKWDDDGNLVALGDASMTAEEVAYAYMKAVAVLDFDTAGRYSRSSNVVTTYMGYYDDADYTMGFKRKMYKEVLKSVIVDKISDKAVFSDSSSIFTFDIEAIDLANKDFWKPDADTIYNNLFTYYRDEADVTKGKQYIYDYILGWYSSEKAPKKKLQVEVTVSKIETGAWVVTKDDDLDKYCQYAEGELVNGYIYECYTNWLESKEK